MATKAKKNVKNRAFKAFDNVKVMAGKTNDFALKTAEEVVTEMIDAAAKWQQLSAKAVKGGLKVADTQQNMVFDALEMAKGHIVKGVERSKTLFSKN